MNAVLQKDLVVVTGKGGVGKTTVALALGLAAAREGRRAIVAEVQGRDEASRALGVDGRSAGGRPSRTEREVAPGLAHLSVAPQDAVEEYLVDQLPVRALAEALASSRLFSYLVAATPGMAELVTVGKVWELAQPTRRRAGDEPYDVVVLDAPATGHGVALLEAPRTFADIARVGPIARHGRTIHDMLADPARTGLVAVATPEEMPVTEALAVRDAARASLGLGLDLAVVNALSEDRLSDADAARLVGRGGAAARLARHQHARARAQHLQLERLRAAVGGEAPVVELPLLVAPELGPAELGTLAERFAA